MLEQCSRFLFFYRNYLFPVFLIVLLIIFPPIPAIGAPFIALTLAGGLLLILGQLLRIATIGLDYIRRGGKNGRFYADDLVTGGLFGHCRNPMYTGNVLIAIGFVGLSANPWAIGLGALIGFLTYRLIIHGEECYLAREFGAAYDRYCADVPRWLPRWPGLAATLGAYRFDWRAVIVREYGTLFTTAGVALIILAIKSARAERLAEDELNYGIALAVLVFLYAVARYLKKSRRLRARRS